MSVVIAVRGKEKGIFVGADSAITSSDNSDTIVSLVDPRLNPKIMKKGPYIIAGAGSPRILNVLRMVEWPEPPSGNINLEDATAHVVGSMLPVLQDCFSHHQISPEQIPGATIYNCQILMAFDDYLFDIGPELSVVSYVEPYVAIGGASRLAIGALRVALQFEKDPKEIIRLALEAASFHSTLCGGPFTIMNTDGAQ